jgi:hypothetical protein
LYSCSTLNSSRGSRAICLSSSKYSFEQGIQSLSNEYLDELKQIALDPLEELRVEQEYNKLKTQIQGRK